jgi:dihydroorotase
MADLILGGGRIRTAEAMLEARFLPDAISSDVHTLSISGPAFDQLVTMSKFLALGMGSPRCWAEPISAACQSGRSAMPACSSWSRVSSSIAMCWEVRPSRHQLAARGLVVGGRRWHPPR